MNLKHLLLALASALALQLPALAQTSTPATKPATEPATKPATEPATKPATEPATEPALVSPPQQQDYRSNQTSDVFGARLFTGAFARAGATRFNPDYLLAVGDRVQVRLWGAFDFDQALTVDPQGNIFIPNAGPVHVLGVRNHELQSRVDAALAKTYRNNVRSYASLAVAQPVRVFVGGNVARPGLYDGTSMDSLLNYLDQAGGIDPERGSFLQVQVKRGQQLRASVNLYDFLLRGTMPQVQLADGDVLFVPPRQNTVKVGGLLNHIQN